MKFSLPLTQRTQTMLRNLRNENFNKLKAKEVRYFMHKQGLNSKGIECLKGQIADYLNNEIIKRIFEAIRVNNFKFAGKGKQLEGLLEAFVSINVFCNLFLREGYSIDEREHFEELVEDFCNHFNQLIAKSPGEYLDKKGLINQLIVLNTHTHGRRMVKIIKRFSSRIFGSKYDSKKFHDYRAWASGANKYTKVTGSAKELILKIDNKNSKPATSIKDERSLLEEVKQYSESLFQWSKDLKGDLGRKLKIYNALRMAGLAHINKDLIADKDFDEKVQTHIVNVLQAVPGGGPRFSQGVMGADAKLYSSYTVNHTTILSLLEAYPQLVNEEIVSNLFGKFEIKKGPLTKIKDHDKRSLAVVVKYLVDNPYNEKLGEIKHGVIERLGKSRPRDTLALMGALKFSDFKVINNFMNNFILGANSDGLKEGIGQTVLEYAIRFMFSLPQSWIKLGLDFRYDLVPYTITVLNLLKNAKNPQSLFNDFQIEDQLVIAEGYQTDFLRKIIDKLKQGKKYEDALVDNFLGYTSKDAIINSNADLVVSKHFLLIHLNKFMLVSSEIEKSSYIASNLHLFDFNLQAKLLKNLDENPKYSEILDIIENKISIFSELRQMKKYFEKKHFAGLLKIKEEALKNNDEFLITMGPQLGTACIYYNNNALVFNYDHVFLEELFKQRDNFLENLCQANKEINDRIEARLTEVPKFLLTNTQLNTEAFKIKQNERKE